VTLQAIDHVQAAMPAGEEDKARAFYSDLLGLPEQPKPAELAKRGGCWFESEAVKVHLGVETPFTPARKAHIAFRVDDVSGLATKARAAGYQVVEDEDLPGFERVYIYDPFGNRLEFLKPAPRGAAPRLTQEQRQFVGILVGAVSGGVEHWAKRRPDLAASEFATVDDDWGVEITQSRRQFLVNLLHEAADGDFADELQTIVGWPPAYARDLRMKLL